MADAEVKSVHVYLLRLAKALKDLQIRIQTSSLKERKEVIENVIFVVGNPESGNIKISSKAFNLLNNSWASAPNSEKLYLDIIQNVELNQNNIVLASIIVKRLSSTNDELLKSYLDKLVDGFTKNFISCKVRPSPNIVMACYPLLHQVNNELFKRIVLPALQKAMLRNPEIILECVGLVISGINLDLGEYAMEIGKSLVVQLHSKDDNARREAADTCKRLANKINDPKALEELLKKTFDVFHGSDGKLTVIDHKMSVLQGAGNFSFNSLTGENLQKLIVIAADHFIKVLGVEVHEKTLCHALEMLSLWTSKLYNEVPKKIIDSLKASVLVPDLLKSVEKAVSQPTIIVSVTEGLCAALMLLKLGPIYQDKDPNFQIMWNAILDMEKQVFVSEKYLATCSEDSLVYVMQLCEILLVQYPEKVVKAARPLYRAILHSSTFSSTSVRRKCLLILRRITGSLSGTSIARSILKELQFFLESNKVTLKMEKEDSKENDNNTCISPHALIECITTLCSSSGLTSEDVHLMAIEALLPAHHPSVIKLVPNLWVKIIKHYNCKPKDLVAQRATHFRQALVESYTATPVST
ncbi:hypothetical protein NQ318_012337 [Aromia moschata]|uniref:Stalled ribosome sensor GCN1-like N-terminal domain-containing protein n=1 Tax=Aromia moschata TaxID=1265417 RepID=A0AAV8XM78_9CUCU|nr:hypothetical protein NQ318_012337 [Aromia moschata]